LARLTVEISHIDNQPLMVMMRMMVVRAGLVQESSSKVAQTTT